MVGWSSPERYVGYNWIVQFFLLTQILEKQHDISIVPRWVCTYRYNTPRRTKWHDRFTNLVGDNAMIRRIQRAQRIWTYHQIWIIRVPTNFVIGEHSQAKNPRNQFRELVKKFDFFLWCFRSPKTTQFIRDYVANHIKSLNFFLRFYNGKFPIFLWKTAKGPMRGTRFRNFEWTVREWKS